MFLNWLVSGWVNKDYQRALVKEKLIGYRIKLHQLNPGWIDGQMIFDMSGIWQSAGIAAEGVNYFTIGAVVNQHSSRFDYQSPYYQAWLGGYLVRFSQSRSWQVNDHFQLGVADQNTWLGQYGDPNPYAKVDYQHIVKHQPIKIGKYRAQLFEGSIFSHTDVGRGKRPLLFPLYMAGFAQTINKSNPELQLKAKNLTPQNYTGKIPLDSFQPIELHGYVAIIEISRFIKAVIYVNGVIFQDKNGHKYNTFKTLQKDFLKAIKDVELS